MNYLTLAITNGIVTDIIQSLHNKLRQKQLDLLITDQLVRSVQGISFQMVSASEMTKPKRISFWNQDTDPSPIPADINAPSSIQFIKDPDGPVFQETSQIQSQQEPSPLPKPRRRRKSTFSKQKDQNTAERGVFALSQPPLTEQQQKLEKDIDLVKKRLYHSRKLRRQYEEEQRRRMEQSTQNKIEEPRYSFTYDFSGEFIKKEEPTLKKHFSVQTKGKSVDFLQEMAEKKKKKAINDEDDESNRDYLNSRQGAGSRQEMRKLYENMGKRQVSHLPFIKLTQTTRLSQNKKSSSMNQDTSRYTMKSYQSRGQSTFRHYSQIQKQKSDQLNSIKRSQLLSQITQDDIEPIQVTFSTQRRQSKRMQKYLNKLCEDKNKKFVTQINKSCNFDRLNSTHDYPVHKFYRHNFDDDKRNICQNSLGNINLQTSSFREVKLTQ